MRVIVKSRLVKLLMAASVAVVAQSALAQLDEQAIVNNIARIGQVCLQGQDCTARGTATSAPVSAAPATTTAVAAPAPAAATVAAAPAAAPAAFDAATVYQQSCFACHGSGVAGAPRLGDSAAWEEKMAKGMDAVVANAMNGINAMPAKGMCMTCSEDDIRALIDYMVRGN